MSHADRDSNVEPSRSQHTGRRGFRSDLAGSRRAGRTGSRGGVPSVLGWRTRRPSLVLALTALECLTLDSTRGLRGTSRPSPPRAHETIQNKGSFETDHWNFRILREQQHCTQSLLTVRGPLQQDVAGPRSSPISTVGGPGVPSLRVGATRLVFL